MKFKTTIEIITEADSKAEATEIAGEYLSGNLVSGVKMTCKTRPSSAAKNGAIVALIISLLVTGGIFSVTQARSPQANNIGLSICGIRGVQPPLKTAPAINVDSGFKKDWNNKITESTLKHITQK